MLITLGFTESDRARGYSSFSDGFRIGARRVCVTIALEGAGTARTAQQRAEAVFAASNDPSSIRDPSVTAIRIALTHQAPGPLRSLSVGDTVTVHGQLLACEPAGWRRIDEQDPDTTSIR